MDQYHKIMIAIILLAGLALRLYGIGYELPFLYHPDEGLFVQKAGLILANRDPNPHWFGVPGGTIIYTLSLIFVVIFLIGRVMGVFQSPRDFGDFFFQDPTVFYLSGRVVFALCGVISLFILWKIARRCFNDRIALIGVILFAVNPLHIYQSKLIRPDIVLTLFILLAFWFSTEMLKQQTWSSYLLAGLFSGLAIATKYPGVIVVFVVAAAALMNRAWQKTVFPKVVGSGLACVLGVFIASPFLFLDFGTVLSDVAHEARDWHLGAKGDGLLQNLMWYVQAPLLETLTIGGLILAGIGLALCIKSGQKDKSLVAMFVVVFTVFISALDLRWDRWIIPIIPFVCILGGYGWDWAIEKVGTLWHRPVGQWMGIAVLVAIVLPLVNADIIQGREMSGKDTRTIAREWILDNIPAGSRLLVEEWTPQLPKERYKFFEIDRAGQLTRVEPAKIDLAAMRPKGRIGNLRDVAAVNRERIEYLIFSNFYDRYAAEKDDFTPYAEMAARYEAVMKMAAKIYEVDRVPGINKGMSIRVYKLD